jgi:hypothetical protein
MTLKADIEYEESLEAAVRDLTTALAESKAKLESVEKIVAWTQSASAHQTSLLDSFWTGNVPDDATLDHLVLAKAGRQRLEEKAKRCALLSPSS